MGKLYVALYYHRPLSKLTYFDIFTSLLRRTVAEKKFNETVFPNVLELIWRILLGYNFFQLKKLFPCRNLI